MNQWIELKHSNGDKTFIKPYKLTKVKIIGGEVLVSYIDEAVVITEKVVNSLGELLLLDEDYCTP